MSPAMDVLCDHRSSVGESPLWSVADQALYWVDIEGRSVQRWRAAEGRFAQWATPERPACIALHADGGLVCGMDSGVFRLHLDDGAAEVRVEDLAPVDHAEDGMRFNDGRCDRHGRFWAGTMVRDMSLARPAGALYRVDAAGLSAPLLRELVTPNGLAFSPDGRRLYLSDSHPDVQRIWTFALAEDGSISEPREFVDMHQHPGRPDGAAVDVDGCYWSCANDAGLVHRFTPDGRLDRSIEVPVAKPAMCAFGGARLDELYITSIRPAGVGPQALAGAVFVTRPGVQGLAEVPFQASLPFPPHVPQRPGDIP